jgi:putative peptidoglycan lipid II flippase
VSQETKTSSRSTSASFFVALGILLSRIAGVIRERVLAHYLGNSDAAGAFKAALRIPNFLQTLFGEGVLSASFIPVYSKLRADGEEELARKVAGVVGATLAFVVSILVLVGVLFTPAFVDIVAPGFEGELKDLTIHIVRVLFPGVGLLVLSAWCLGILNSHRKFFISYFAPVLWNAAQIATLIYWGPKSTQADLAVILAWGVVVGCGLQFGIQIPFVWSTAGRVVFGFDTKLAPVREIFRNLGPVFIGRGVVQLSAYIDAMIASFLGAAAVSSLGFAQTLYLLPVSLFGMAVAAAELPSLSITAGHDETAHAKLRTRLIAGRRQIAFFVIPSAAAFLFLGRSVVAAIFQTGAFGPEDTLYVWYILMGAVVGLLAATWGRLYSSAFYALRDTKTPLRFALVRVALTITLGLLFAFPLRPYLNLFFEKMPGLRLPDIKNASMAMGAVGLTASAGIAGWIEFLLLQAGLSRRIGPTVLPRVYLVQIWSAALTAALLALWLEKALWTRLALQFQLQIWHYDLVPLLVLASFGALYLCFAIAMRIDETQSLLRRLRLKR